MNRKLEKDLFYDSLQSSETEKGIIRIKIRRNKWKKEKYGKISKGTIFLEIPCITNVTLQYKHDPDLEEIEFFLSLSSSVISFLQENVDNSQKKAIFLLGGNYPLKFTTFLMMSNKVHLLKRGKENFDSSGITNLEFFHELSFSDINISTYGLIITKKGKSTFYETIFINPFRIYELQLVSFCSFDVISTFLHGAGGLLKKLLTKEFIVYYFGVKKLNKKAGIREESEFFDVLNVLMIQFKFSKDEIHLFLVFLSTILNLLFLHEKKSKKKFFGENLQSNLLRLFENFPSLMDVVKKCNDNVKLIACYVHLEMMNWIMERINLIEKEKSLMNLEENIPYFRKIVLIPEKENISSGKIRSFVDFCYNILSDHIYILNLHHQKNVENSEIEKYKKTIELFFMLEKFKFTSENKLLRFVVDGKYGSAGKRKKIQFLDLPHTFGNVDYELKSFVFTEKVEFMIAIMKKNINTIFSGYGDLCFVIVENSSEEILKNLIVKKILNSNEEKFKIKKEDVLNSISFVQMVIKSRLQKKRYFDRLKDYQIESVFLIRKKFALIRINKWYRECKGRKLLKRNQSAVIIQRTFRRFFSRRREIAACVIQFHCKRFLRRKIEKWIEDTLNRTASVIQIGYRKWKNKS